MHTANSRRFLISLLLPAAAATLSEAGPTGGNTFENPHQGDLIAEEFSLPDRSSDPIDRKIAFEVNCRF